LWNWQFQWELELVVECSSLVCSFVFLENTFDKGFGKIYLVVSFCVNRAYKMLILDKKNMKFVVPI